MKKNNLEPLRSLYESPEMESWGIHCREILCLSRPGGNNPMDEEYLGDGGFIEE